ncbi:uncharacterized protein [Amphiura filiformis]|uniref:uncharacterized protein n=1 Tax=Amphiura filiformis TaxID=82378 RepID=UPI003B20ED63
MATTSNNSTSTTPPNANSAPAHEDTPALVKRQQFQQRFQSPTDNILSPCSKMLSDPVALMRQKQKPKLLSTAYSNSMKQQQMKAKMQQTSSAPKEENKEN